MRWAFAEMRARRPGEKECSRLPGSGSTAGWPPGSGSGTRISRGDALAVRENAFVSEQSLELPALVHFPHDVTAADERAFNVELRDGRPVRGRDYL